MPGSISRQSGTVPVGPRLDRTKERFERAAGKLLVRRKRRRAAHQDQRDSAVLLSCLRIMGQQRHRPIPPCPLSEASRSPTDVSGSIAAAICIRQCPSLTERRKASHHSIATASPWSSRPSPAVASIAWAKLWPRLSKARRPLRSSGSAPRSAPALIQQPRRGCERCPIRRRLSRAMLVRPSEERGVVDQSLFDDFRIAGAKLAEVERIEQGRVRENQSGLWKVADEVLLPAAPIAVVTADGACPPGRGECLGRE